MSGANRSGSSQIADITLDELERLIRLLGLLGSQHDGEILNAAKFAQRWVVEHATDWRTLLTPEPEQGVVAVSAPEDPDLLEQAHEADRAQAFKNGYAAGMRDMAAQVKAQAAFAASATMAAQAPQSPLGGVWPPAGAGQGPAPQGPHRAPGGPGGAAVNLHPTGSWQYVAQQLLNLDAQGIPGVFRGSREQDFVASLLTRGWKTLTGPQETWLRDIAGRNGMSW